jgi:hypothetical protein
VRTTSESFLAVECIQVSGGAEEGKKWKASPECKSKMGGKAEKRFRSIHAPWLSTTFDNQPFHLPISFLAYSCPCLPAHLRTQ